MTYRSSWMTEELDVFRDQFRRFLARDLAPCTPAVPATAAPTFVA